MKKHVFFTLYLIFIAYSSLFPKSVSAKKNADTLLNQGVSFYNQGSYEEAITCFLEVVKRASEQKKIITLCKAYNNLGNCYSYKRILAISSKQATMKYFLLGSYSTNTVVSSTSNFQSTMEYCLIDSYSAMP